MEARVLLEVPAARLAARAPVSEADLERLRATVPGEPLRARHAEEFAYNAEFHACLLEASRNTLLTVAAQPIFTVLQTHLARSTLGRSFHTRDPCPPPPDPGGVEAGGRRRRRGRDARPPRVPAAVLRERLEGVARRPPRRVAACCSGSRAAASSPAALPPTGAVPRGRGAAPRSSGTTRSGPASTSPSTTRSSTSASRLRPSPRSPSRILLGAGSCCSRSAPRASSPSSSRSLDYVSGGRAAARRRCRRRGRAGLRGRGCADRRAWARAPTRAIAALRELFAPRPRRFEGRFSRFDGVSIEPRPPQPGGPPSWSAAAREAAQRRAGRLGDGWLPYLVSPRRYAAGVEEVRAHAEGAGRDPEALDHGLVTFARVERRRPSVHARQLAAHLSHRYGMRFEPHARGAPLRRRDAGGVRRARPGVRRGGHRRTSSFNPAVDADGCSSRCERLRAGAVVAQEALA